MLFKKNDIIPSGNRKFYRVKNDTTTIKYYHFMVEFHKDQIIPAGITSFAKIEAIDDVELEPFEIDDDTFVYLFSYKGPIIFDSGDTKLCTNPLATITFEGTDEYKYLIDKYEPIMLSDYIEN